MTTITPPTIHVRRGRFTICGRHLRYLRAETDAWIGEESREVTTCEGCRKWDAANKYMGSDKAKPPK